MNKKRWLEILSCFNTQTTMTSEALAERLSVSSRTVRKELKELQDTVEINGAHLHSKSSVGYYLEIEDSEKYNNFLNGLKKAEYIPESSQERVQYLLEHLLMNEKQYVKVEELCDRLCVSRSSLTADLRQVRKLLETYHLQLITKPGYGIRVNGSEFNLRLCLASYMIGGAESESQEQQEALRLIADCIRQGLEEFGLKVSDVFFQNLIVHIFVALKRIKENVHIPLKEEQMEQLRDEMEFLCAERITFLLEECFQMTIPETETGYITIHLASKRMIESSQNNENLVIDDEIYELVGKMLDVIWRIYGIDLRGDLELRMLLATHLVPFSVRMQYDMKLKNPLLGEIKSHYSLAYMMAVSACEILQDYYQKQIGEDEIGYFALPFSLAMERKATNIKKKNILVVCSTGKGSSQLLLYRLKSEFETYLDQITTCDVRELKNRDLSEVDYVVTTVPIPYPVKRPILQIRVFPEAADVQAIQKLLSGRNTSLLEKYLHPQLFMTGVEAKDKREVLELMTEQIRRVRKIPEDFLDAVLERERMAATAFGNLAAIPHPNRAMTEESFVCVAFLKNPISWDHEKVQLVFLLSLSQGGDEEMQNFIPLLSRLLFNREAVLTLIKTPSYENMMQLLKYMENEVK